MTLDRRRQRDGPYPGFTLAREKRAWCLERHEALCLCVSAHECFWCTKFFSLHRPCTNLPLSPFLSFLCSSSFFTFIYTFLCLILFNMGAVQSKQRRRRDSASMHGADSGTGSSFFGMSSNDSQSSSSVSTALSHSPQPYQSQHQHQHQHQNQNQNQYSKQPRQRTVSASRSRPLRAGSHTELPTHQQPPMPTRRKTSTSVPTAHRRETQQHSHHHPALPSIPIPLLNDKHNHHPRDLLPPSPTKSPPHQKSDSNYTGELHEDSEFLPENWESHDRFFSVKGNMHKRFNMHSTYHQPCSFISLSDG